MDSRIQDPDYTESWSADLRAVESTGAARATGAEEDRAPKSPTFTPEPLLQVLIHPDPWPQDDRLALLLDMADGADEACYREGHSRRVAGLVRILVAEEGLPEDQVQALLIAARLHDIGKMGMPLEWIEAAAHDVEAHRRIRAHAARGADFVTGLALPEAALNAIRHHHELWDGTGYPSGMAGVDIPLGARIIGLAEAIDAASAPAPPSRPWTVARLLAWAQHDAGRKWDPEIVARLTRLLLPALVAASGTANPRGLSLDPHRLHLPVDRSRLA